MTVSEIQKKSEPGIRRTIRPVQFDDIVPSDIGSEKSVDQLIRDLIEDEDEMVRSAAAGTLGIIKSDKSIEALIRALQDRHVYVRHGAAWALGEIKSEKAIEPLYRSALTDNDRITRGKAAEALWKIQKEKSRSPE